MSGEFEKTKDKEIQNKNIIINDNINLSNKKQMMIRYVLMI